MLISCLRPNARQSLPERGSSVHIAQLCVLISWLKNGGDGRVLVLFFLFGKHPRTTDATLLPLLKNGPLVDNMDPTAPEFHHLPSS